MNDYTTTKLVNAIEYCWQSIQSNHEEVPDVVVTIGSGAHARGLKLGHYAHNTWDRSGDAMSELFVGGEGLQRPAEAVLGTLLHEAAHGIARTRDIQDTSRQGRYHNKHFRGIAEEVGITVEQVPIIGWSKTSLPASTAVRYSDELEKLREALTLYRKGMVPEEVSPVKRKAAPKRIKVNCPSCARDVNFLLDEWEAGVLHCGPCDEDYVPV